jgi:nucleoside-diphosphate-sugar epimerase
MTTNMVLVTGANGFIGRELCNRILGERRPLRAASRSGTAFEGADNVMFDMEKTDDFASYLCGIDVIIHLAARAHQLKDKATDPLGAFISMNRDASLRFMQAAAENGVKRFVYVSSIGVNGNWTVPGHPFTEADPPRPQEPYAVSKYEAELALAELAAASGMELVVVRPPLVYGPNAPGNFARMIKLVNTGLPLPLGAIDNVRSFIYVRNLVDALLVCALRPQAVGRTYVVSDGEDISTPGLIAAIATMTNKPVRLLPVPPKLVRGLLQGVGKAGLFDKLAGSLQVDSSRIRNELDWYPPFTLHQGLQATLKAEG